MGLKEETALLYLHRHEYQIDKALEESIENPQILRQIIKAENKGEQRSELVAYIGELIQ